MVSHKIYSDFDWSILLKEISISKLAINRIGYKYGALIQKNKMKIFFLLPTLLLAKKSKNIECGIPQAMAASASFVEIINAGGPTVGADLANFYVEDAIVQGGGAVATIGKCAIAAFYQNFVDTDAPQVEFVDQIYRCLAKGVFLQVGTVKYTIDGEEILYFFNSVGYYDKKTGKILYEHDSFGQ